MATDARLRCPPESLSTRVWAWPVRSSSSSTLRTAALRSSLVASGSRSSAAYLRAASTVNW